MKADEFISEEQKLDEIIPLIVGAARGVAAGVGAAAKVAGRVGSAVSKGVVGAASSAGRMAANKLGADDEEPAEADPNAVVGTQSQPNVKTSTIPPKPSTQRPTITPAIQSKAGAAIPNIKPGANLQLPTSSGRVGNFKVSKVMGKNIEIENPDKMKNANEPDKLIYNKDDLIKSLGLK